MDTYIACVRCMGGDGSHVPGLVSVKGTDFKEVRAKLKRDYKSDPDCRQGALANFKSNKNCMFVRRLAIIDGKERRYRMVKLNSGNVCFQLATDITSPGSDDEDEVSDSEEEEPGGAPPAPPPPPAASKKLKRAAAPKEAEPRAAEGASSSTEVPPKRQRKQVQRD